MAKQITLAEVAKHACKESCWIVVHDKVYDITAFLEEHPGGEEVQLANSGKDASDEFENRRHSSDAQEIMKQYCIGELVESERTGSQPKMQQLGSCGVAEEHAFPWSSVLLAVIVAIVVGCLYQTYLV